MKATRDLKETIRNQLAKVPFILIAFEHYSHASSFYLLDIVSTLSYIQQLLMHLGPMISAILFTIAGIFYAVGQVMPPDKRAVFHTTAINVIIGAVAVAILSVASNGLALASANLLTNITYNSIQ